MSNFNQLEGFDSENISRYSSVGQSGSINNIATGMRDYMQSSTLSDIKDDVTNVFDRIKSGLGKTYDYVKENIKTDTNKLYNKGEDIYDELKSDVDNMYPKYGSQMNPNQMSGDLASLVPSLAPTQPNLQPIVPSNLQPIEPYKHNIWYDALVILVFVIILFLLYKFLCKV